jgi:hypothetical protein
MRRSIKTLAGMLFLLLHASLFSSLTGCLKSRVGGGGSGDGNSGSVLTAISGIDDTDRARSGIQYSLICDSGAKVEGKIEKVNGEEFVVFKAAQVKEKDKCAMEVRASVDPAMIYEWRGIKGDGKEDVGLYYGSTKGEVSADRKLTLTLYKLYIEKAKDPFTAKIRVLFELTEGTTTGVMPADGLKTGANLVCKDNNYAGKFDKTGDLTATLTFEMSAAVLKGQTCESVVIVDLDKKVSTFNGAITGVSFPAPEVNKPYDFPADLAAAPFVVKPVAVTTDDLLTTLTNADCVTGYQVDTHACLDRRVVTLPDAKNYILAKVKAKSKAGDEVSYFVSAGEGTIGLFTGKEFSVEAINKVLADNAPDSDKKLFGFWNSTLDAAIFNHAFDSDLVSGKPISEAMVTRDSLAGAVKFMHIDSLWYHGFQEVKAESLNKSLSARWLALVTAKKDGQPDVEFLAGGHDKYFASTKAPAGTDIDPKYFDMNTLVQEMAAEGTSKWRVYALKAGAMAAGTCENDKTYYLHSLSEGSVEALRDGGSEAAKLDSCEVTKESFSAAALGSYTTEVTYYVWGWHKI